MKKNSSHKTLSIVKRISITNIGIFIIACILSIVATLKLNVEYHIDRDAQMMKVYISNTLSSIDNTLKDMGRVSLIAFSDQMVQDILKGTDYSFDEKMENEEYLTKLYSSMISIRDDVRGIYIFNNEDMVFYSDTWNPFLGFDWNVESFFQDVKINSDLSTNISGCHMYVGTLPEGFKYTQTYTKNIFQENNIYLVRPIRSFSPFEVIGYIALRTPILTLQKICSNYLEDNISYIVADENNNIACSSNERIISQNLKDVYPELLDHMNGAKGSFSLTLNQEKYLCAYQRSDYSNMLLITLKTYESIYDELNILVITCIIITAISALVVLFCVYGFTRKNLKRLTDFSLDIQNFQPGDLTRQYDVGYMDEVGVLKDSFNKMIRRLNDLVISEYQARDQLQKAEISEQKMAMLYLKQQINPHFLYNTLDSIRWIAVIQKNSGIVKMVTALSGLLKNMAKGFNEKVTLKKELEFLNDYVTIEKVKYVELFDLEIQVDDPGLYEAKVIKLTLQPLVENAIFNGIEPKGRHGIIKIRASRQEDMLVLTVRDNGVGIPKERLKTLLENTEKVKGNSMSGIGLPNVDRRIKLNYGESYSLMVDSTEGKFTEITVTMPLEF